MCEFIYFYFLVNLINIWRCAHFIIIIIIHHLIFMLTITQSFSIQYTYIHYILHERMTVHDSTYERVFILFWISAVRSCQWRHNIRNKPHTRTRITCLLNYYYLEEPMIDHIYVCHYLDTAQYVICTFAFIIMVAIRYVWRNSPQ